MADRIEREIEEILRKLETEDAGSSSAPPGEPPGKRPIPISSRRRRSGRSLSSRIAGAISLPGIGVSPATLILAGGGLTLAGFILASFASALIWLSVAGILLFILGFALSFIRRPARASAGPAGPQTRYWRGRKIEYDTSPGALSRIRNAFRRK